MDLVALPPDCAQSGLAAGSGRFSGRAVTAGSTTTSPSPVRTAMRWPQTRDHLGWGKLVEFESGLADQRRSAQRFGDAVVLGKRAIDVGRELHVVLLNCKGRASELSRNADALASSLRKRVQLCWHLRSV